MPNLPGQKLRSTDERRRIAIRLSAYKLHGLHVCEIAQLEKMPESTVRYYLSEFERITRIDATGLKRDRLALQMVLASKEREKHWWLLYQKTEIDKIKAVCLTNIREEHAYAVKIAQEFGLAEPEPVKHLVEHSGEVAFKPTEAPEHDLVDHLRAGGSERLN